MFTFCTCNRIWNLLFCCLDSYVWTSTSVLNLCWRLGISYALCQIYLGIKISNLPRCCPRINVQPTLFNLEYILPCLLVLLSFFLTLSII